MDETAGKIGFDRSRVRILLCDKDPVTAQEVKELLCRCSYQVSVVKTARQVVEVLNLVDSKVDLVLSEVELPNGKGFKMLKHIVKTESFKHIPIVMMSAHDEMAVVVKCLRLGAADYLVKPLRINELLNLWTHMWRRRRMLGLTENHIIKGHFNSKNIIADIFVSDTSESNTISTDILSEDSNDGKFKPKESNLKPISEEIEVAPELELSLTPLSKESKAAEIHQRPERKLSPPRKSELRLGQSSAFLSYSRSMNRPTNKEKPDAARNESTACQTPQGTSRLKPSQQKSDATGSERGAEASGKCGRECDKGHAASEDGQFQREVPWNSGNQKQDGIGCRDQYPVMQICAQNDSRTSAGVFNSIGQSHLVSPMMVTHSLHPLQPTLHYYQPVQAEGSMNVSNHMHSTPAAFSYYPFPIHMASQQPWPALPPAPPPERKNSLSERREAALNKFRQKRKDRCFEKKIRYASRKRLAEQRPRVKGQFVRRTEDGDEEEEEDDESTSMSPESGVEVTQ